MIASLTGKLIHKSPDHCVIDVGGVGYSVLVSLSTYATLPEEGETLSLNIYTHVREDQLLLYGFATASEKALFQRLISISGVGPKTSLAILSGLPADELASAISSGDALRLSSTPGVGKKTAERIIMELKDRILSDMDKAGKPPASYPGGIQEDAISALVNLGYKRSVAENALKRVKAPDGMRIEDVIRSALQELSCI